MRVLIVDDEPHARAKLRRMLDELPDIEVVGEAADGREAIRCCRLLSPQAIFLDMQMPEMDGFTVMAHLPSPRPGIVMVTAFEQHALRAFDADVCDYLLKPVSGERLQRAVLRLRASLHSVDLATGDNIRKKLMIHDRCKTTLLDHSAIDWLESADNYVLVHVGGRSSLVRRTLSSVLDELGPSFIRIHRCFAVPIDRVEGINSRGGGAVVVLTGPQELPCSRQHRSALVARLQELRLQQHALRPAIVRRRGATAIEPCAGSDCEPRSAAIPVGQAQR